MIKLNRLTDYAVMILAQMGKEPGTITKSASLAAETGLPQPTISKILKILTKKNLVVSYRGANGGYSAAHSLDKITVADLIEALDGPLALTACVEGASENCNVEAFCPVRGGWNRINKVIRAALEQVSLAELCTPEISPRLPNYNSPNEIRRGLN